MIAGETPAPHFAGETPTPPLYIMQTRTNDDRTHCSWWGRWWGYWSAHGTAGIDTHSPLSHLSLDSLSLSQSLNSHTLAITMLSTHAHSHDTHTHTHTVGRAITWSSRHQHVAQKGSARRSERRFASLQMVCVRATNIRSMMIQRTHTIQQRQGDGRVAGSSTKISFSTYLFSIQSTRVVILALPHQLELDSNCRNSKALKSSVLSNFPSLATPGP